MSLLVVAALAVVGAVVVEFVLPGESVYHTGWYNVFVAALVAIAIVAGRRRLRHAQSARRRLATATVVIGTAIVGLAGVASGLFAPDNQRIVGAPGQRVHVEELGELRFPLGSPGSGPQDAVTLRRPLRSPVKIALRPGYSGNFILRTIPRTVVYVEARDLRGNRLTVTQPSGSAFLSPVLLMEHRQNLAGLDLPYDSFNVPSARRVVKTVMFTPAQAAMLLHDSASLGQPAVLFAVDDENERPLPHAIALSVAGRAVRAGGLILQGSAETYPAVEVVASPNLLATALGTLLVLGGLIALISP